MSEPGDQTLELNAGSPQPGRRGRAKADAEPETVAEQVTYLAGDGDPPSTKWHGIVFRANVPKMVTKPLLIEQARGNRFFKVGKFDADKDQAPLPGFAGDPKTSAEYRSHIIGWVNKLGGQHPQPEDIEEMIKTFVAEARMREMCEVGSDDYSFIGSIFLPKMHELARAAGLNDDQLAKAWARYGLFQLPF